MTETRWIRAAVVLVCVSMFGGTASAHAVVTPGDPDDDPYYNILCSGQYYSRHFAHASAVPVYISSHLTAGMNTLGKDGGGTWTLAEIERMTRQAIIEVNENSGIAVRLYFAGTHTSGTSVTNAILIRAVEANPNMAQTSNHTSTCSTVSPNFPGRYTGSNIEFYRRSTVGGALRPWSFRESGAAIWPFVSVLVHEFLHALGLTHAPPFFDGNTWYTPSAVIQDNGPPYAGLHFHAYDRDVLQALYGPRTGTYHEKISGAAQGYGVSWVTGDLNNQGAPMMSRIGKPSEGAIAHHVAYPQTTYPLLSGMLKYSNGTEYGMSLTSDPIHSSPSIAYSPAAATFRMYYVAKAEPTTGGGPPPDPEPPWTREYGTDQKKICWNESSDGQNWTFGGCIVDPATGDPVTTFTDFVNAGYDPYRMLWIVTWIADDYDVMVMASPAPGSSVAAPNITYTGHQSWDAPAIACSGSSTGCVLVFMTQTFTWYLKTVRSYFDASGGWIAYSSFDSFSDLDQYGAPSISYQPWNLKFVLTFIKGDMKTVRSYRKTLSNTAWFDQATVQTATVACSLPSIGWDEFCVIGCLDPRPTITTMIYPM